MKHPQREGVRWNRGTWAVDDEDGNVRRLRLSQIFILLFCTALISVSFSSCAYFNTLYNARKIFREAEDTRVQGASDRQLRDKYQEVIKKCSKVVRDYPNSRWVDDALFLMGQALVRQGELNKGIRKFVELTTNFPESEYVPRAHYWMALAYFEKLDYNQALYSVDTFLREYPQDDLRYRVMFLAGDINRELGNDEEALNFYASVAEESSNSDIVSEAVLKSAELFFAREEWEKAEVNYEKVLRKGLSWEERYSISLALGECYTKIGKCREALEIFDRLISESTVTKEKPPLILGRASGYICMDSLETAISVLEEVTKQFPKSTHSAEAFYRIGIIYHEKMDSVQKAQEAFAKVSAEYASSEYASVALQRSNSLKRLIELVRTAGKDETAEQAAEKRFLAAEIQLTRLDEIDLSLDNYQSVIDSFPETSYAPKAAYAVAWIHHRKKNNREKAIEYYRSVISSFPRSPQARGAIDEIGDLGAEELRKRMEALIDSALADTTATTLPHEGAPSPVDTLTAPVQERGAPSPVDTLTTPSPLRVRSSPADTLPTVSPGKDTSAVDTLRSAKGKERD